MPEKILVTGGTGFLGGYLVRRLIIAAYSPLVTFRGSAPSIPADVLPLDITDTAKTSELILSVRPDIVFHLAGTTADHKCHEVNFIATSHLLEACSKIGVKRVIMLGSAAEYGELPTPFREDMPGIPASRYGISKAKATEFALNMHADNGFPVTILRVFTAYGVGQPRNMFLSQLVTHALLNRDFNMSDGLQRRDFVFVDDVVDALISAMTAVGVLGRVINIGGGIGIALRTVAEKVWALAEADPEILHFGTISATPGEAYDTEADITLARELLDWRPTVGIMDDDDRPGTLFNLIRTFSSGAAAADL